MRTKTSSSTPAKTTRNLKIETSIGPAVPYVVGRTRESFIPHGRVLTCNPTCRRDRDHFGPCLPFRLEDLELQPSGSPFCGAPERMVLQGRIPDHWRRVSEWPYLDGRP